MRVKAVGGGGIYVCMPSINITSEPSRRLSLPLNNPHISLTMYLLQAEVIETGIGARAGTLLQTTGHL